MSAISSSTATSLSGSLWNHLSHTPPIFWLPLTGKDQRHPVDSFHPTTRFWLWRWSSCSFYKPHSLAREHRFARQVGLNINTLKTKVMWINSTPHAPITVNGNYLDYVKEFMYLGSLLSKDIACSRDISSRLRRGHRIFESLQTIWRSKLDARN